jgi:hypothetical protein
MKYKKDFRLEVFFIGRFSPIFEVFHIAKTLLFTGKRFKCTSRLAYFKR